MTDAPQDSQLQTPQADQPIPSEPERQAAQPTDATPQGSGAPVQDGLQYKDPFRKSSPLPERDQQAEHDERERARDAQRQEHNARTGGGDIQIGERQAANEEHLAKTAGESDTSDDEPQGD